MAAAFGCSKRNKKKNKRGNLKKLHIVLSLNLLFYGLNIGASQPIQPQSSLPNFRICAGTISLGCGLWWTVKYANLWRKLKCPKPPEKIMIAKPADLTLCETNIAHLASIQSFAADEAITLAERTKKLQEKAECLDLQENCDDNFKVKDIIKNHASDILPDIFKLDKKARDAFVEQFKYDNPVELKKRRTIFVASKLEQAFIEQKEKQAKIEQHWQSKQQEEDDKYPGKYGTYWERNIQYSCSNKLHGLRATLGLACAGTGLALLLYGRKS